MPAESHTDTYPQQYHTKDDGAGSDDSRTSDFYDFLKTELQTKSKQQEDNANIRPCLNVGGIHY